MAHLIAKKKQEKLAEDLYKKTHFTKHECETLLALFRNITSEPRIDRATFRDLLHDTFHMTDDIIMDRVFRAFDSDNDGFISPTEWVLNLSIFLMGTVIEKTEFAFKLYDLNDDGYISREEMFTMLKSSLVKQPTEEDPDEGIKDLVELVLKKMDVDHDSRVSLQDYITTINNEPLLLEAFGPCLPDNKTRAEFLTTFLQRQDAMDTIQSTSV